MSDPPLYDIDSKIKWLESELSSNYNSIFCERGIFEKFDFEKIDRLRKLPTDKGQKC